jgi:hypothetical protein
MNELEAYASANLSDEINEIQNSFRKNIITELSIYEKALIYKYSDDGFKETNEELRSSGGKILSEFAKYLRNTLDKLGNFEGLVYRKVYLTITEYKRYEDYFKNSKALKEYSFISTTKSRLIAMEFEGTTSYVPNCLFRIQTKTGKDIELITKFAEKEVLIQPNTKFRILDIRDEGDYKLITMEEV